MDYRQYRVSPCLSKWIRYYWSYDSFPSEVRPLFIRSFADRYPRLIFQDSSSSSLIQETNGGCKPVCYLSGIDTLSSETSWDSYFSHFGVSFHSHALSAIFGITASELVNQTPDIQLIVRDELTGLFSKAKNHLERVAQLEKYFYNKIYSGKQDPIIEYIFRQGIQDKLDGSVKIASAAKAFKISERQLQRRFKNSVGVSAGKLSRLAKFERALQLLSEARYGELTGLAYTLGYADQSHFIHDFKLFSGISPYEFVRTQNIGSESASFIYLR